jgi:putative membrane-bound dehydrogenase-like protein
MRNTSWLVTSTLAFPFAILGSTCLPAAEPHRLHVFERQHLSDVFLCEGATFGDVSGDGVSDIVAGPYWYPGPDFNARQEYYAPKPFDVKGYSDNFFAYLHDLSGDGALDIVIIGFPGQEASWFENPRGAPGHWRRHLAFAAVDNESPTFGDLTGDGRPEIVCHTGGRFGYAAYDPAEARKPWTFTPIGEKREVGRFTHGLGVGDVNGDGRLDILEKDGWYEQPASLAGAPLWTYRPHPFAPDVGGAQMHAYDVDGDRDADVITSQNAHGFGLVWHEQVRKEGEISFVEHRILGKTPAESDGGLALAQMHAIDLVDMDGDGLKDIVTGKRVWAHHGEPTAEPPGLLYWLKLRRGTGEGSGAGEVSFAPYLIDNASGVGTQVVAGDIDRDGLPDVVVGNKLGTFVLKHRVKEVTREEWRRAQPRGMAKSGLTPAEAADHMTVPDGFQVDLVAGEPNLHQPVAFTFDERGRIWVAEAHTYPNRVKGRQGRWDEGKDRIVIFEDGDGNGSFETRKVFTEGINLVSGLEVGFGGVWVGAAPYLLFFPDRDRDDRPDGEPEILLDGFGFHDTHETLNAFIWGPDGWLYGCHGVFTHARVGKPGTPDAERVPLNAGVWRFHPTRRTFEVFAWGTSNPWGVDFNDLGQAFITACVIPHLFHVIQGARYERQAGAHFDAHVYGEIVTIADHAHYAGNIADHAWWGHEPAAPQATLEAGGGHAHCGAMIYLADTFPERYRDNLFLCNIHGNRVNTDILERRGSGYVGRHGKDFLVANDRWFRGINLKYGPDGAVYLIDWYDKNACHRTQPEIWDRTSGRLYRVSPVTPAGSRRKIDLASASPQVLAALCLDANDWYVRTARRLLAERGQGAAAARPLLEILRTNERVDRKLRALWALHAAGVLEERILAECLGSSEEHVRAWAVQLAAEGRSVSPALRERFAELAAKDASPVVRLYLASALQRLPLDQRLPIARGLASHAEDAGDHNLPFLLWYGIEPLVAALPKEGLALATETRIPQLARFIARRAASRIDDLEPLMAHLLRADVDPKPVVEEMRTAFAEQAGLKMPAGWQPVYERLAQSADRSVTDLADAIAVKFGDRRVFPRLRAKLADGGAPLPERERALSVLLDGNDPELATVLEGLIADVALRSRAIKALARYEGADAPGAILPRYASLPASEQTDGLNTLASRKSWGLALLDAVRGGKVPRKDLGAFTIRQLRGFNDEKLTAAIEEVWGTVRETSEDKREEIAKLKAALTPDALAAADTRAGRAVFAKTCATCHVLFGAGGKVAPDITGSNRADLDYILENLVDPSAVVGKDYLMTVFALRDGRFVNGLVLRESETAFTVRTINEEVLVAKADIAEQMPSELSLMPEGQLKTLTAEEVRDLIAYLASPVQTLLPAAPVRIDPATRRAEGVLEGEKLEILKVTGGGAAPQEMSPFGVGKWSGSHQLWWTGAGPGSRLELRVKVEKAATYAVEGALTMAPDYGVVQLWLDGQKLESPIDLYSPRVVTTGNALLGEARLEPGDHVLGVEVLGANPAAAKAYMFGVDYVRLAEKG